MAHVIRAGCLEQNLQPREIGKCIHIFEALPSDAWVWEHEPSAVGLPRFLVMGRAYGIVALDLFLWRPPEIREVRTDGIRCSNGQVYYPVAELSQKLENLRARLKGCAGYDGLDGLLLLPGLSQADFEKLNLSRAIPPEVACTADELTPEQFEAALPRLAVPWTEETVAECRARLFPETTFEPSARVTDEGRAERSRVRIQLAAEQEKLVRSLGSECCLLKGVAGSGKTLLLAARARVLAEAHPDWRILLVCYNRALLKTFDQLLGPWASRVEANTFLTWAKQHSVYLPWNDDDESLVKDMQRVLRAIERCQLEEKYDAILVDEGQDFRPTWFWLLYSALRPGRGGMLVVMDSSQAIYREAAYDGLSQASQIISVLRAGTRKAEAGKSSTLLQRMVNVLLLRKCSQGPDVSVTAQNVISRDAITKMRTIHLLTNYRNTEQIGRFAIRCAAHLGLALSDPDWFEESEAASFRTSGEKVQIVWCDCWDKQAEFIGREIRRLVDNKIVDYKNISIFHTTHRGTKRRLENACKSFGIPYSAFERSAESRRSFDLKQQTVKLMSVHSAKGLEFPVVFFFGVDALKLYDNASALDGFQRQQIKLAYVAMTRATDLLYLTFTRENRLIQVARHLLEWCRFSAYPEDFA